MASLIITDPTMTYTLNQFISLKKKDNITYQNFSILEKSTVVPGSFYSVDNIIYNYLDDIEDKISTVKVDEMERIKYMYKPKLLAYDIYGANETFFILMALNGIHNIKDFTLTDYTFKALSPTDMFQIMSHIYNAEEESIKLNRRYVGLT